MSCLCISFLCIIVLCDVLPFLEKGYGRSSGETSPRSVQFNKSLNFLLYLFGFSADARWKKHMVSGQTQISNSDGNVDILDAAAIQRLTAQ